MTTLIRKIATNITSSLVLFFISISNNRKNVTANVTCHLEMLHPMLHATRQVKGLNQSNVLRLTQVVLPPLFEISYGNPIIERNVKNDKN